MNALMMALVVGSALVAWLREGREERPYDWQEDDPDLW